MNNDDFPGTIPSENDDTKMAKPILDQVDSKIRLGWLWVCLTFIAGIASGYLAWGRPQPDPVGLIQGKAQPQGSIPSSAREDYVILFEQVNPQAGFTLPARYGDIGPALISAGAIDLKSFTGLYQSQGHPLTDDQISMLTEGSDSPVVINSGNAHFLLNLFWAFGLTNANPILSDGPITQHSQGSIERFASTGGWTLGARPAKELFASVEIVSLSRQQQNKVEEVASVVYRPCCNNATIFPDCNHGMAMLGLLELMASQGASVDEMLEAAKYINAFWFPQQAYEAAIYLKSSQNTSFKEADPRQVIGQEMFSASGFQMVHQSLLGKGLLQQSPEQGNGCGS